MSKLFTAAQLKILRANGAAQAAGGEADHKPVVKLFLTGSACTWLLTELDADNDTAFGLCDVGHGTPELGYVSLAEISSLKNRMGLKVERDRYFEAKMTLIEYAKAAKLAGEIVA